MVVIRQFSEGAVKGPKSWWHKEHHTFSCAHPSTQPSTINDRKDRKPRRKQQNHGGLCRLCLINHRLHMQLIVIRENLTTCLSSAVQEQEPLEASFYLSNDDFRHDLLLNEMNATSSPLNLLLVTYYIICKTRFCYFGTYDAFKLALINDNYISCTTHHLFSHCT
jgi:hypothetical protein